jgi:hypothetical protein
MGSIRLAQGACRPSSGANIQLSSAKAATLARRLALTTSRSSAHEELVMTWPRQERDSREGQTFGLVRNGILVDLVVLHRVGEPLPLLYKQECELGIRTPHPSIQQGTTTRGKGSVCVLSCSCLSSAADSSGSSKTGVGGSPREISPRSSRTTISDVSEGTSTSRSSVSAELDDVGVGRRVNWLWKRLRRTLVVVGGGGAGRGRGMAPGRVVDRVRSVISSGVSNTCSRNLMSGRMRVLVWRIFASPARFENGRRLPLYLYVDDES